MTPKILIEVRGGAICNIVATEDIPVTIIDWDDIKFFRERIEAQNQPGYDPFRGGDIMERQYYPLDVEMTENKLRELYAKLGELKAQQHGKTS